MTALVAFALVVAVAVFVVAPLLRGAVETPASGHSAGAELWNREKSVAVLAISEADFDRATGKLSDEDYRVLRSDYEGRALQAMDELEKRAPAEAPSSSSGDRFCAGCGAAYGIADLFCGVCGRSRAVSGLDEKVRA